MPEEIQDACGKIADVTLAAASVKAVILSQPSVDYSAMRQVYCGKLQTKKSIGLCVIVLVPHQSTKILPATWKLHRNQMNRKFWACTARRKRE